MNYLKRARRMTTAALVLDIIFLALTAAVVFAIPLLFGMTFKEMLDLPDGLFGCLIFLINLLMVIISKHHLKKPFPSGKTPTVCGIVSLSIILVLSAVESVWWSTTVSTAVSTLSNTTNAAQYQQAAYIQNYMPAQHAAFSFIALSIAYVSALLVLGSGLFTAGTARMLKIESDSDSDNTKENSEIDASVVADAIADNEHPVDNTDIGAVIEADTDKYIEAETAMLTSKRTGNVRKSAKVHKSRKSKQKASKNKKEITNDVIDEIQDSANEISRPVVAIDKKDTAIKDDVQDTATNITASIEKSTVDTKNDVKQKAENATVNKEKNTHKVAARKVSNQQFDKPAATSYKRHSKNNHKS